MEDCNYNYFANYLGIRVWSLSLMFVNVYDENGLGIFTHIFGEVLSWNELHKAIREK